MWCLGWGGGGEEEGKSGVCVVLGEGEGGVSGMWEVELGGWLRGGLPVLQERGGRDGCHDRLCSWMTVLYCTVLYCTASHHQMGGFNQV